MAENPSTKGDGSTPTPVRQPWTAPRLLEYGHIGKLTQGASGTAGEGTTKRINTMCL